MTAPSDHGHNGHPVPPLGAAGPSTQEIPIAVPTTERTVAPSPAVPQGATAAAARTPLPLPAPGQLPQQPVQQHVPPPLPPAWPDTLVDEPVVRQDDPVVQHETVHQDDDAVRPTGPVDFVPGLPGVGTEFPPPPPAQVHPAADQPSAGRAPLGRSIRDRAAQVRAPRVRRPHEGAPQARRDRGPVAAVGLAALSVLLLQLGLLHDDADLWDTATLWAVFATAATVVGLLALAVRLTGNRLSAVTATRIGVAAVLALAIFWLLVVLPIVAGDPGFLVTLALIALGAALWIGPRTTR